MMDQVLPHSGEDHQLFLACTHISQCSVVLNVGWTDVDCLNLIWIPHSKCTPHAQRMLASSHTLHVQINSVLMPPGMF